MSKVIKTTFQLRRGLKQDWETVNPLLAYGEPGFEVDTNKLKIGTGLEEWNDLDYLSGGTALPEVSSADNGDILTVVEGEWAKAVPSSGGADWDANQDEAGYIANRPFYSTNQTQSAVVSFISGSDSPNSDHTTADTPFGDMFGEDVPYYMDETWPSMSTTAGQFVTDVVNSDIEDITVVFEGGSITYYYNANLTNTYPDLNSDITKWYVDSTDNPTSLLYLASSQDYACGAVGIVVKWEIASTLFPNADIPAEEPQGNFDSFSYGDLTLQVQTEVVAKTLDPKYLPVKTDFITFNLTYNEGSSSYITAVTCDKTYNELLSYYNAHKESNWFYRYNGGSSPQTDEEDIAFINVQLIVNNSIYQNLSYTVRKFYRALNDDYALTLEPIGPPAFVRYGEVIGGSGAEYITLDSFSFAIKPDNSLVASLSIYEWSADYTHTYGELDPDSDATY